MHVIELQHNDIAFAAIYTWMIFQVTPHILPLCGSFFQTTLITPAKMNGSICAVVSFAVGALARAAI